MLKNILIIGGTSGLGLELAKIYDALGHTVFITGRKDPNIHNLHFFKLSIDQNNQNLVTQIDELIRNIDKINTLIYVAGYYQEGKIDQLNDKEILEMINTGLTAPAILIQRLKNNPGKPLKVMFVTSSSQYTPRELEPIYTAVKSGLGMLGASLSLDQSIGKVLVVAPSGMKTPFWNDSHNTSGYLNPTWVAEQIVELSSGPFKYRYAKILRDPERVEIVETKQ
ncbi:MAG: short-chain dehydrogenase/reductase [Proteobacteria bacterium]|nr:short-chain dehydrogenase/reductase [Pseudomonadota bacterium]